MLNRANRKLSFQAFFCFVTCCFVSINASADPVTVTVHNNKVEAVIELPGGIETEFEINFDESLGLNTSSIGLSAELVNVLDPVLLSRLPDSLQTSLPAAFPMMITVEPPSDQGLSFEGLASVSLHTHNLDYSVNTPLRLFKAPLGGQFRDITVSTGAGSYRVRSSTGGFSQFLVVVDLRPIATVINTKLTRLNDLFNTHQMNIDPSVALDIQNYLTDVNSYIGTGSYNSASQKLLKLIKVIKNADGNEIPNVWRSSRDITNVAGELIAQAQTLRYSLRIAN